MVGSVFELDWGLPENADNSGLLAAFLHPVIVRRVRDAAHEAHLRSQPLSLRATALKLRTWGIIVNAIETQSGAPFSRLILVLCCAAMVIKLTKHRPMLCAATLNACSVGALVLQSPKSAAVRCFRC
jgi:hypothetical protein